MARKSLYILALLALVALPPAAAAQGFTADNLKVGATFMTKLSDHGIPIPQMLLLKLSNELQLETDVTFVRAQ